MEKHCSKCKTIKNISDFPKNKSRPDGYAYWCKACYLIRNKKYYFDNREEQNQKRLDYYYKTKESHRDRRIKSNKEKYRKNKDKMLADNARYTKERSKTDINFKIRRNLRIRLHTALKRNYKAGSAVKDLGCSIDEFKQYIESKFQIGMSWNNYGKWEFDHIKPLSKFNLTDREQFLKACHYTNIQPLWKKDNQKKHNKYEEK